ncbi:hypothetical protein YPPY60_2864, partial [Yersinia pestis PY-60]
MMPAASERIIFSIS